MTWGEVNVDEQRMRFVVLAKRREKSLAELCREFRISRQTGYTWLNRYQAGGVAAVVEGSRRPKYSPRQIESGREERVVAARRLRPDWGACKLQVELRNEGCPLPVSTIHRILFRQNLIRVQDRHPHAIQRFEREQPNQLWQMDFKSPKGWDSHVGPLSLLDDHSRYALALQQIGSTHTEGVQEQLQAVFQENGLPDAMLMDHGTPWWNAQTANGWTALTVWLMKQGIRLYFSGYRHPQTQGKVERFHGSLQAAMARRGLPPAPQRQGWLDEFRYEYNHRRPHEALKMDVPAHFWQPSPRPFQENPEPWSYDPGAELRRVTEGGHLTIDSQQFPISRALRGESVELIRVDRRLLVYYCKTLIREIDLVSGRSLAVAELDHRRPS
jgi:transposase InsO family protein